MERGNFDDKTAEGRHAAPRERTLVPVSDKRLFFWRLDRTRYAEFCGAFDATETYPQFRRQLEHDLVWARRAGFEVILVDATVDEVLHTLKALNATPDAHGRSLALRAIYELRNTGGQG